MSTRASSVAALLVAAKIVGGCAPQIEAPPPPLGPFEAELGTTHVTTTTTPPPEQPPPPIYELAASTRALLRARDTLDHHRVIAALRALADAGTLIAPDRMADVELIRRAADELERSDPRSLRHAEHLRYGLDAAVRMFSAVRPPRADDYDRVLTELATAVSEIDTRIPLLRQQPAVDRAFASAARAGFVAYGAPPPDLGEG